MKKVIGFLTLVFLIGCTPLARLESNNSPWCAERQLNGEYIVQWKNGTVSLIHSTDIESWIDKQTNELLRVEPNYRIRKNDMIFPDLDDSDFPDFNTWSVNELRHALGLRSAWNRDYRGQGIVVAVVDSGVDPNHPYLVDHIANNPGESGNLSANNRDDDNNGYIDDIHGWNFVNQSAQQNDEIGHGTVIAGLITGGQYYSKNVAIAPEAKVLPVDFMDADGGSEYHAYLALDYAVKNRANIINNSWSMDCSSLLEERFRSWEHNNIIFVNAAGNMGIDAFHSRKMPASLNLLNFLNVGATNRRGQKSYFSNFGPSINIYAPGQDIPVIPSQGSFPDPASGTSLSAGVVSGAAAVLWSAFPNASAQQIIQILVTGRVLPQGQAPRLSITGAIREGRRKGYHHLNPSSAPSSRLSKSLQFFPR